jgi:hypothetical protein
VHSDKLIGMTVFKLETCSKLISNEVCFGERDRVENRTSHSQVFVMQCAHVRTDLHELSCKEGYECIHSISQLSLSMTEV